MIRYAALMILAAAALCVGVVNAPTCKPDSPHGPRIGGVMLIAGCP